MTGTRLAGRIFTFAGIYGLVALLPLYFLKHQIDMDQPPAITHVEFYYGFIGVGVAWQVVFLIIGRDPARYRLLMLPAILEKVSYGAVAVVLFLNGRLAGNLLTGGIVDLILALAFGVALIRTVEAG